jgi:hypothetical protein
MIPLTQFVNFIGPISSLNVNAKCQLFYNRKKKSSSNTLLCFTAQKHEQLAPASKVLSSYIYTNLNMSYQNK